jgi:hypothetical protein
MLGVTGVHWYYLILYNMSILSSKLFHSILISSLCPNCKESHRENGVCALQYGIYSLFRQGICLFSPNIVTDLENYQKNLAFCVEISTLALFRI